MACKLLRISLFQFDDVTPSRRGILALVIVFNSVGKDIRLALPVLLCVLLRPDDNRLGAMQAIDTIYHLVQASHLLNGLCIRIEEILLNRTVRPDTHYDDTSLLVLVALTIDTLQHLAGSTHQGDCTIGRRDKPRLLEVPVLGQILTEHIGVEEHPHNRSDCLLLPQLLRTTGCI